ncbi:MAG TPA: serine hydrolase domain-containing protein [Herpetosiphonaceae bacterium]
MLNLYRLEQRVQQAVQERRYVGLALALVQGGDITYARGFGTTSVEDGGIAVTPDTLFCIGSISKSLTGTLVMRLVEQGKLDLDEPVISYLPGFAFSDPKLGQAVTLRHVLSHSTGLPAAGKDFGPRDPDALRRFVWDEIPRYQFIAEPGKVHLYNNTVIVLAGYLAEVVTGRYYDQLVQELIFEPLRMRRSTFDRTVAMTYPLALAHEVDAHGVLRTRHHFTDNVSGNPAGFGISSTLDLANFAIMHLNQGRFQDTALLTPESVALMHTPQASRYRLGYEAGYGLGFYTGHYKGVRHVTHGGMLESYNCLLTLFPQRELAVILQCNYEDGSDMGSLVGALYNELLDLPAARFQPAAVAPDRSAWPRYVGTYLSVHSGLATIEIVDDQLMLELNGETMPLTAVEGGLYHTGSTYVGFVAEASGPVQYVMIDSEPYRRFARDHSFVPDVGAWAAYTGAYAVWEIDPTPIKIRIADDRLHMQWWGDEVVCTPLTATSFISPRGLIEFEPAEDGGPPVLVTAGGAARRYRVSSAT